MASKTMKMTTGGSARAEIEGLDEFLRELRTLKADNPWRKQMAQAGIKASGVIYSQAKARAQRGRPHQALAAQRGMKHIKSFRESGIRLTNSGRSAFAFGAEFGSLRYKQFREWRGNQWKSWDGGPGYFLHPAIRDRGDQAFKIYEEEAMRLMRRAYDSGGI